MFSDLKKYKFYYWFAFPTALINWTLSPERPDISPFTGTQDLTTAIEDWRQTVPHKQWGFFFVSQKTGSDGWTVSALADYDKLDQSETTYVAFCDPSSYPQVPGWPLRNLLLLMHHYNLLHFPVLAYRGALEGSSFTLTAHAAAVPAADSPDFKVTGWERVSNKLVPKQANLGALLDPLKLADQAVDLNLKLMKWRIAPDLDLDIVKDTSCLLLGAGTLGSYIARGLMGWGVRKITFVDSGRVSYSNPVRQPLYTFADCADGGAVKAVRAAQALKEIYPSMDAEGYQLEIPMAGHPVRDEAAQRADYEKLAELIKSHDAVFLLVDSRESRWLPTVMAAAQGKLVINAALGFDSYVVMRHGVLNSEGDGKEPNVPNVGCYFCNDIVAPIDSLSNRTLDQMCTVTRPGVSLLASAFAVEILVSLLQHPKRGLAPVFSTDKSSSSASNDSGALGTGSGVPHQIRGFLGSFETLQISGQAYPSCSACSAPVREAWAAEGWEFVKRALNEPEYVEELSGLGEIKRRAEELEKEMEMGMGWSDDEDGIEIA